MFEFFIQKLISIDIRLIVYSQWIVRQCELYTPITRDDLFSLLILSLRLISYIVIPFFNVIEVFKIADNKQELYILLGIKLFLVLIYGILVEKSCRDFSQNYHKQKRGGTLPQEIITRMTYRLVGIAASPIMIFNLILISAVLLPNKLHEMIAVSTTLIIIIIFEYLLCTTSLPPEEKKKIMMEKELRNMIPART